jgi:DNA-binding transcriptional LysR family regulator
VPSPTALASDFSVITALVAAGAGVALVPRMALPDVLPAEIVLHPLATPVTRTISALIRTGEARLPALAQVIEALRAAGSAVA